MRSSVTNLFLLAGAAAFGAGGLALALFGLGVPFALADLIAAAVAGLLVAAVAGRARGGGTDERLRLAELRTANLRHELRGALSPALIISDRLVRHPDPAISRAGETVTRSVDRAVALLVENKRAAEAPASPPPDLPIASE